ncbi:hypothetical protein DFH09DRAFT_1086254 [Mycena vulgaris]|nr:hypothetical protein DFH09DRAFT_1086254 [Mycena vulgaris]
MSATNDVVFTEVQNLESPHALMDSDVAILESLLKAREHQLELLRKAYFQVRGDYQAVLAERDTLLVRHEEQCTQYRHVILLLKKLTPSTELKDQTANVHFCAWHKLQAATRLTPVVMDPGAGGANSRLISL